MLDIRRAYSYPFLRAAREERLGGHTNTVLISTPTGTVPVVTGKAAQAQDELCRQAERYKRPADRMAATLEKQPPVAFSWIRDRKV